MTEKDDMPVTLTTVHKATENLTKAVGELDKNISVFIASQVEINKSLSGKDTDRKEAITSTREDLELIKRKVWAYPSVSLVGSIAAIVVAVKK